MDFFKVSQEEIANATTGSKALFADNEKVKFTIKELKQKVINDKENLLISCAVTSDSDKSNGKDHTFFIDDKPNSMKTWVKILRCFFTDEQIASGIDPMTLVAGEFESIAKKSFKDQKEYTNFYEFTSAEGAVLDTPAAFNLF